MLHFLGILLGIILALILIGIIIIILFFGIAGLCAIVGLILGKPNWGTYLFEIDVEGRE